MIGISIHWDKIPKTHMKAPTKSGRYFRRLSLDMK